MSTRFQQLINASEALSNSMKEDLQRTLDLQKRLQSVIEYADEQRSSIDCVMDELHIEHEVQKPEPTVSSEPEPTVIQEPEEEVVFIGELVNEPEPEPTASTTHTALLESEVIDAEVVYAIVPCEVTEWYGMYGLTDEFYSKLQAKYERLIDGLSYTEANYNLVAEHMKYVILSNTTDVAEWVHELHYGKRS